MRWLLANPGELTLPNWTESSNEFWLGGTLHDDWACILTFDFLGEPDAQKSEAFYNEVCRRLRLVELREPLQLQQPEHSLDFLARFSIPAENLSRCKTITCCPNRSHTSLHQNRHLLWIRICHSVNSRPRGIGFAGIYPQAALACTCDPFPTHRSMVLLPMFR